MAEPSEAERRKTRKRQLAAEAVFLLLLLQALKKKRGTKAALLQALLRGQLPLRQLARERIVAELRLKQIPGQLPPISQIEQLSRAEVLRITRIVSRFAAYEQARTSNANTKELKKQAETAVDSRLRLIAANEAVRAFEQERRATVAAAAKEQKRGVTKKWDATLDSETCDECSKLDGTEIPMNDEFPQGDPPLHPNCRCSIEYRFDS